MNPVCFTLSGCMATLLILVITSPGCQGHGRLMDPPSRASMWRVGFNSTPDYEDNQCFCGGFVRQYEVNDGKCGVCGDPFDADPKEHEAGGTWGEGIITANYSQAQVIDVQVQITAHHQGYMEFRICAHNDIKTEVTQDCLDQHVLGLASNGETLQNITGGHTGYYNYKLQLPYEMVCEQCVIQWKYHAGNSYACDDAGNCCVGCGDQEEFYGCADVRILEDLGTIMTLTTPATTTAAVAVPVGQCVPVASYENTPGMDDWCKDNCQWTDCTGVCACPSDGEDPDVTIPSTTPTTTRTTTTTTTTTSVAVSVEHCVPVAPWDGVPGMDDWCKTANCQHTDCTGVCSCP